MVSTEEGDYLLDLNSRNGTTVNGVPLMGETKKDVYKRQLKIMPAVLALQERFNFTSHAESPPLFYIHFFILRAEERVQQEISSLE